MYSLIQSPKKSTTTVATINEMEPYGFTDIEQSHPACPCARESGDYPPRRRYLICLALCLLTTVAYVATDRSWLARLDPSDQSLSPEEHPKHPVAVLHFGPRKTATSSIQKAMVDLTDVMTEDGFFSEGIGHPFYNRVASKYLHDCKAGSKEWQSKEERDNCQGPHAATWEALVDQIHENHQQGKSLLFSDEDVYHLAIEAQNSTLFFQELDRLTAPYRGHRIVTVTYRDYPEWIVSQYNQFNSLKYAEKRELLGFVDWYRETKESRPYFLHPMNHEQMEHYKQTFGAQVKIFNMHQVEDSEDGLLASWFCQTLPWATRTCSALRQQARAPPPSSDQDHIHVNTSDQRLPALLLALKHLQLERVQTKQDMAVLLETEEVIDHWLNDMAAKVVSLPVQCLSDEEFEEIWQSSLVLRQLLAPDFDPLNTGLRAKFETATSRGDYCQLDSSAIFQLDSWKALWRDNN